MDERCKCGNPKPSNWHLCNECHTGVVPWHVVAKRWKGMSGESLSVYKAKSIGQIAEKKVRLALLEWLCSDMDSARMLGIADLVRSMCDEQE
jgi:hypothetical protein